MGYYTDFSGSIELPGLKGNNIKRLQNILKRHFPGRSNELQIKQDEQGCRLAIWVNWKNYHDEIQKLAMSIVRAFPGSATGCIDARGEDRDDNWALEIGGGKVLIISYAQTVKDRTILFNARGGRHHD